MLKVESFLHSEALQGVFGKNNEELLVLKETGHRTCLASKIEKQEAFFNIIPIRLIKDEAQFKTNQAAIN